MSSTAAIVFIIPTSIPKPHPSHHTQRRHHRHDDRLPSTPSGPALLLPTQEIEENPLCLLRRSPGPRFLSFTPITFSNSFAMPVLCMQHPSSSPRHDYVSLCVPSPIATYAFPTSPVLPACVCDSPTPSTHPSHHSCLRHSSFCSLRATYQL
jgi:hypothetical protein